MSEDKNLAMDFKYSNMNSRQPLLIGHLENLSLNCIAFSSKHSFILPKQKGI